MKKISLCLAIAAILFASYESKAWLMTQYKIYCVSSTSQPPYGEQNNPAWYRNYATPIDQSTYEFTQAQMDTKANIHCEPDPKICLVQIKELEGVAMEIKGMRLGICNR